MALVEQNSTKQLKNSLLKQNSPMQLDMALLKQPLFLQEQIPAKSVFESTGPEIEGIELIINNPDKKTGEGEIWAKGPNVMKGYYKEPEMTKEVLTPDGWFKTGDLGTLDNNNNLFIKGRLKEYDSQLQRRKYLS